MTLYPLLRPLLFTLDAEIAHGLSLRALKSGLLPASPPPDPRLRQTLLGLDFASPIGLAAGYDKNGEAIAALHGLGFAFVEVGTVTPRPQAGNPRPRLFRLERDRAVINRLGFNNDGFAVVHARLIQRSAGGVVGVNIGANRDSPDAIADYVAGVARFADAADYMVLNISSPNTPGLRDLQKGGALGALLAAVEGARARAKRRPPVLLKLAPDLDDAGLAAAVETALSSHVDGLVIANTTLTRDGVRDPQRSESGGLSGEPLYRRATIMLAKARRLAGKRTKIVGVGGIHSATTAWEKLAAGADLVQLYTGMIHEGPGLAGRIAQGLAARLDREGIASIRDIVGSDTDRRAVMTP